MSVPRWKIPSILVSTLLVFAAILLFVTPVHAEGEPPPEAQPTQETPTELVPAEDGESQTETIPTVEPDSEEPLDADEQPTAEDEAVTEESPISEETSPEMPVETATPPPATEETTATPEAPMMEEEPPLDAPTDTVEQVVSDLAEAGLALGDADGNPMPLASEETEQAILIPDPWYVSGRITYRFVGDCTDYLGVPNTVCTEITTGNPIQSAIDDMLANNRLPNDRLIHVEKGDFTGNVVLDATAPGANILGGLRGIVGNGIENVDPQDNSTVTGTFSFSGLREGFTLKGFIIAPTSGSTAVLFDGNVGTITLMDLWVTNTAGDGIKVVNHSGNVNVTRVSAKGNNGEGLWIDNTVRSSPVTIIDSEVDGNGNSGATPDGAALTIRSTGSVTLNGVSASKNLATGASIQTSSSVAVRNSVFSQNTHPAAGHGAGLVFTPDSNGPVVLDNLTVHDNEETGISVATHGATVVASNLLVQDNGAGMLIDTCAFNGTACDTRGTGHVTLTNLFVTGNNGAGIDVIARGNITLNNIMSDSNGYGAHLSNINSPAPANVTVNNSTFSYNGGAGLEVDTRGTVMLYATEAYNNTGAGTDIDNSTGKATVTIKPANGLFARFNANGGTGVLIRSSGTVYLLNLEVNDNDAGGVDVRNDFAGLASGVTLSNVSAVNNTGGLGINVITMGNIGLALITASGNSGGASLDNAAAIKALGVSIIRSLFYNNGGTGLNVLTKGAITLNTVDATFNVGANSSGAVLDNTAGTQGVNILASYGRNYFDQNDHTGLWIKTNGKISITKISASDNNTFGARVIANTGSANNSFYMIDATIYDNLGPGLEVQNRGSILIRYSDVDNNAGGIILNNCQSDGTACLGNGGVTITGTRTIRNTFSYNDGGLVVTTRGAISITDMNINGMGTTGVNNNGNAYLDNCHYNITSGMCEATYIYSVSLTNVTLDGNDGNAGSGPVGTALFVRTNGSIVLNNVEASHAQNTGADLDNSSSTSRVGVTLVNSKFNYNNGHGAKIRSRYYISVRGGETAYNLNNGLDLSNAIDTANIRIDLRDLTTHHNGGNGVEAVSNNSVNSYNNIAHSNNGIGFLLTSNNTAVTVSRGKSYLNASGGLQITAHGTINISLIHANGNGGYGILAANNFGTLTSPVYLTSVIADGNNGNGVTVTTFGSIVAKTLQTSGNGNYGANLSNEGGYTRASIVVTSGSINNLFNNNSNNGLNIRAVNGASISRVIADNNGNRGISVFSDKSTVSISAATLRSNNGDGVNVETVGAIILSVVNSLSNGRNVGGDGSSGAVLISHEYDISVSNSNFVGNGNYGLFTMTEDGSSPNNHWLRLYNTRYYGNRLDAGTNASNLAYNGLISIR